MELNFKEKYAQLSDRELIALITNESHHDEEAATYLLWTKYSPLLHKLFLDIIKDMKWYDYAVEGLFIYLRGKDGQWLKLSSFQWRSSFGYWFKKTSHNFFLDYRKHLIDIGAIIVLTKGNDPETLPLPDPEIERNKQKTMLMEAISLLKERDQKFVVLKRLQGYSSKEIAELMQKMWNKYDIVRISNGKQLVPTEGYVNVLMQRAKIELKKIIVTID